MRPPQNPSFAALIPAAGLSSRMHRYKPLLPLGKTNMIRAVISSFQDAGIKEIYVITGHNHDRLAPVAEAAGACPVFNAQYESGMFSSIQKGVNALPQNIRGFFLLPVDIPAVRPSTLCMIHGAFEKNKDRLVIPEFDATPGHPPLIPARMIPAIKAAEPNTNLRQILFQGNIVSLAVHDRAILMDADTPEAYAQVKTKYESREIPEKGECLSIINQELADAPLVRAHLDRVSQTAEKLGEAVNQGDLNLNISLIQAGALLHDIKRNRPDHDRAGYHFLRGLGFPGVAEIAGDHMTLIPGPLLTEKQIVYFSDKLCREDRLDLDYPLRFRQKAGAFPHAEKEIINRLETAQLIQTRIESAAGRSFREILR